MTFSKIVLGFTGIAFTGYGAYCALDPDVVARYSGLAFPTPGAVVEVRAMYGGLQTGLGLLLLYTATRPALHVHGLVMMLFALGGLALCRAFGLALAGVDEYNAGAVVYESVSALLAFLALRRERSAADTAAAV